MLGLSTGKRWPPSAATTVSSTPSQTEGKQYRTCRERRVASLAARATLSQDGVHGAVDSSKFGKKRKCLPSSYPADRVNHHCLVHLRPIHIQPVYISKNATSFRQYTSRRRVKLSLCPTYRVHTYVVVWPIHPHLRAVAPCCSRG